MSTLLTDFRSATRQLLKNPGFALVAILTLGVGIGATVVIFSVFNGVVLRQLPYPHPEQLARLRELTPQGHVFSLSEPNFTDYRERSRSFSHLVAVLHRPTALTRDGDPQRLTGVAATQGIFELFGFAPIMGRPFSVEEFKVGDGAAVVALSHGMWENVFGGDPDIIGTTVDLDGTIRTVVAVMPEDFDSPLGADVWFPMANNAASPRDEHRLEAYGRLRSGVSLERAQVELNGIAGVLGEEYPQTNRGWGASLISLRDSQIGPRATRITYVLLGAGGLLLLLACASVSNLLLVRATERSREIALRATLGAVPHRIVRQLVVEGLVLAGFSAAVGLLFAAWVLPVIQSLEADALPRLHEASVDTTVILFTILVSVFTGLVCGAAPAFQASAENVEETLRAGERLVSGRGRGLRDILVAGQLALAVVLLVGAGLLLNSFVRMMDVDPGFDAENVLATEITLPESKYPELSPQINAFYKEALERIVNIPGVNAAGVSSVSLLSGNRPGNWVAPESDAESQESFTPIQWRAVSPGFFEAMNVRLLGGRFFDSREFAVESSPFFRQDSIGEFNVVIGEKLAAVLSATDDIVGTRLIWNSPGGYVLHVVGVVADIGDISFPDPPQPTVFLPAAIAPSPTMTLMVTGAGDPNEYAPLVRAQLWAVDAGISIDNMRPLGEILDSVALSGPRLNALLVGFFASAALALAALGIYGVTAFSVARRTREIGVRMALGADPGELVTMSLRRGIRLILVGTSVGLIGAFGLSHFLESMLYGIRPSDPITYLVVTLTLFVVAMLANYLPARHATQVDPRVAFLTE